MAVVRPVGQESEVVRSAGAVESSGNGLATAGHLPPVTSLVFPRLLQSEPNLGTMASVLDRGWQYGAGAGGGVYLTPVPGPPHYVNPCRPDSLTITINRGKEHTKSNIRRLAFGGKSSGTLVTGDSYTDEDEYNGYKASGGPIFSDQERLTWTKVEESDLGTSVYEADTDGFSMAFSNFAEVKTTGDQPSDCLWRQVVERASEARIGNNGQVSYTPRTREAIVTTVKNPSGDFGENGETQDWGPKSTVPNYEFDLHTRHLKGETRALWYRVYFNLQATVQGDSAFASDAVICRRWWFEWKTRGSGGTGKLRIVVYPQQKGGNCKSGPMGAF